MLIPKLNEIASTLNLTRISELTFIMSAVQKNAADTASGLLKWGAIASAVDAIADVVKTVYGADGVLGKQRLDDIAGDLRSVKDLMDGVSGAGGHFDQVKNKLDDLLKEDGLLGQIRDKAGNLDKLPGIDDKLGDIASKLPSSKDKWDKLDNLDKLPNKEKWDKLDNLDGVKKDLDDINGKLPDNKSKWDKLDLLDRLPDFSIDFPFNLELLISKLLNPCGAWPDLLFCPGSLPDIDPQNLETQDIGDDISPLITGAGSCPADQSVSLSSGQSITLSLSPLCDLASSINGLVIALGYLLAARILVSAVRV